ncbi:hypothetical protein PG991_016101 [Apiospora marii]|uniref:DUF6594 domain-containing protein n=1 Tax=Apiospora marii TaxID=335849 RepID=A0ABR1R1H2_9PEZI
MTLDRARPVIRPRGYPKLASFMVEHDYVILRQFRELAVRDLLYLQAEICQLELDLKDQGMEDAKASNDRRYYDCDWWRLHQGEERATGGEQWELALKIRAKLRDYKLKAHPINVIDTAMQQYQSMISSRRPSSQQRMELQNYINFESLGGFCQFIGSDLGGIESIPTVYDQTHQQDLLFLREDTMEDDFLSRLMVGPALKLFHQIWRVFKRPLSHDPEIAGERGQLSALWKYSDRRIRLVTNLVGSGISSLLPMLSIIALFHVNDMLARLGLVCAFTVIFSVSMFAATQCRRVEIFAATAAYAIKPRDLGAWLIRLMQIRERTGSIHWYDHTEWLNVKYIVGMNDCQTCTIRDMGRTILWVLAGSISYPLFG